MDEAEEPIPAVQQPEVDGRVDVQLRRGRDLEEGAQGHVDVAGLVPPDVLAGQLLQADRQRGQQYGQQQDAHPGRATKFVRHRPGSPAAPAPPGRKSGFSQTMSVAQLSAALSSM